MVPLPVALDCCVGWSAGSGGRLALVLALALVLVAFGAAAAAKKRLCGWLDGPLYVVEVVEVRSGAVRGEVGSEVGGEGSEAGEGVGRC